MSTPTPPPTPTQTTLATPNTNPLFQTITRVITATLFALLLAAALVLLIRCVRKLLGWDKAVHHARTRSRSPPGLFRRRRREITDPLATRADSLPPEIEPLALAAEIDRARRSSVQWPRRVALYEPPEEEPLATEIEILRRRNSVQRQRRVALYDPPGEIM